MIIKPFSRKAGNVSRCTQPPSATALEVLVPNGVEVMIAPGDKDTPARVISHAFLNYGRGRKDGLADGIVVTPSYNPPQDGGVKWSLFNGATADTVATGGIEPPADGLRRVRQEPFQGADLLRRILEKA